VGCGGKAQTTGSAASATRSSARTSSDTSTAPHASPIVTRAQLVAQANAICRKENAALADANVTGKSPHEIADAVVRNESIEREAVRELSRLTPPSAVAVDYLTMLEERTSLANLLSDLAAAVLRNSVDPLKGLANSKLAKEKQQFRKRLRRVARKVGFKDCATIGST
jgi:hypothetical protein